MHSTGRNWPSSHFPFTVQITPLRQKIIRLNSASLRGLYFRHSSSCARIQPCIKLQGCSQLPESARQNITEYQAEGETRAISYFKYLERHRSLAWPQILPLFNSMIRYDQLDLMAALQPAASPGASIPCAVSRGPPRLDGVEGGEALLTGIA
jgi:hypothetical protein